MPQQVGSMARFIALFVGIIFSVFLSLGIGLAQAKEEDSIAQSFKADGNVTNGTIVSLKADSAGVVQPANVERAAQLVGVIAVNPLVEFSNEKAKIKVVTSGSTYALVSDINGEIKTGDKITASPIEGIGMKNTEPSMIVGTAQANLKNVELKEHKVTDKNGTSRTVNIGRIPVLVNVTFYAETEGQTDFLPAFVQDIANAVAGKPVSPIRVVASIMVLVVSLFSVAILLFTSVRSSIISIGRNPLSEGSIHKSLLEVGGVVLGVLLITFGAIYLLLVM